MPKNLFFMLVKYTTLLFKLDLSLDASLCSAYPLLAKSFAKRVFKQFLFFIKKKMLGSN